MKATKVKSKKYNHTDRYQPGWNGPHDQHREPEPAIACVQAVSRLFDDHTKLFRTLPHIAYCGQSLQELFMGDAHLHFVKISGSFEKAQLGWVATIHVSTIVKMTIFSTAVWIGMNL